MYMCNLKMHHVIEEKLIISKNPRTYIDKIRTVSVFLTIFYTSINTFFSSISKLIGIETHPVTMLLAILIYGTTIMMAAISVPSLKCENLGLLILVLFFYLFSLCLNPNNTEYLLGNEMLRYFWVESIPVYVCTSTIRNEDYICKFFVIIGKLVIFFQFFLSVGNHISASWIDRSNYMELSYQLLLPVSYFVLKESTTNLEKILTAVGSFIIIFEGGRFAVFCLGTVFVFKILSNMWNKKNMRFSMIIIMIATMVSINFGIVMEWLLEFAENENLYGHFIRTLRSGQVFASNSRIKIYHHAGELIKNNLIIGYGMGGDRYYMSQSYVHQFFLEIWIDFGIVIGTAIEIAVGCLLIKVFLAKKSKLKTVILAFFFSMGFLKLLLSSSYIIEPSFWAMLGLAINLIRKERISLPK